MNGWRIALSPWLVLVLVVSVTSCSDDSAEPPPEGNAKEVAATNPNVESQQQPASKSDFVLTEAIPLTTGLAAAYEET
jgi:hypothetical protein